MHGLVAIDATKLKVQRGHDLGLKQETAPVWGPNTYAFLLDTRDNAPVRFSLPYTLMFLVLR